MKKQLFKIFTEGGKEIAINSLIAEGWKIVHFCSNSYGVYNGSLFFAVLFERDE